MEPLEIFYKAQCSGNLFFQITFLNQSTIGNNLLLLADMLMETNTNALTLGSKAQALSNSHSLVLLTLNMISNTLCSLIQQKAKEYLWECTISNKASLSLHTLVSSMPSTKKCLSISLVKTLFSKCMMECSKTLLLSYMNNNIKSNLYRKDCGMNTG